MEGRKEGRKEGRQEGRKEGRDKGEIYCTLKKVPSTRILEEDSERISWSWHTCAPLPPPNVKVSRTTQAELCPAG